MSALLYILHRSLKNIIRELVRKPAALIAYLLIGCFFLAMFLINILIPQESVVSANMELAKAIMTVGIVFMFITSFNAALSGVSFFRMADVNLLFTAPLKAGNLLIYGFVKQLAVGCMLLLVLGMQYPQWKRTFGFADGGGWIFAVVIFLTVALSSVLSMVLYSFASRKIQRVAVARKVLYGLVFAFLLPIPVGFYRTGDVYQSIVGWLSNEQLRYIPIVGWFRILLFGVYTGVTAEVLLFGLLAILTLIAALFYLYRIDTEFYEHVLSGTERKEAMVKKVQEGKSGMPNSGLLFRKVKGKFTLEGSMAIFQRQLLEIRKRGVWLISPRTVFLVLGAGIAAVLVPADGMDIVTGILVAFVYMMFILSSIGTWETDLASHYIYMIPEEPVKKMICSTLPEVLRILIEATLIFTVVGVLLRISFANLLGAVFAYVSIGAVFSYSDLVVRRLFGKIHGNMLRVFFRIVLIIGVLIIVAVPAVFASLSAESYLVGYVTVVFANTILIAVFMLIGVGLFQNPELHS
jgi:hypothetical protein